MELQTISKVSAAFDVSTRTLRYYEQIGLMKSTRTEGYAYRVYEPEAVRRLEQILILRKLQIPLKQIKSIMNNGNASAAIEVFTENIAELTSEIEALSTIRGILVDLTEFLRKNIGVNVDRLLLSDESIISSIGSITKSKPSLKEKNRMDNLNKAEKEVKKLKKARIVYLPPATVAAVQFYCDEPEMHAAAAIDKFVRSADLGSLKPDSRHYGFNNPNPSPDTPEDMPDHGYEMWVTIPDDMDVPEPLVKKHFKGGMYAAHAIKMGDFHEWGWLWEWVQASEKYDYECREPESMGGCLEEQLNYLNNLKDMRFREEDMQLDLLTPVKLKSE